MYYRTVVLQGQQTANATPILYVYKLIFCLDKVLWLSHVHMQSVPEAEAAGRQHLYGDGCFSPPPQTSVLDGLSLCLTGPVWEDMMSGCQDIYSNTSWLVVRILIVISINSSRNKWNRSWAGIFHWSWQIVLRFLRKTLLKGKWRNIRKQKWCF